MRKIAKSAAFYHIMYVFNRFGLKGALLSIIVGLSLPSVAQQTLPSFEELGEVRQKAHQTRFRDFVLQKLEVYSSAYKQRGMCLDFVGDSDGLYISFFDSGPIMIDLANCGQENDFIDGRVKAIRILGPTEHREGLTKAQVEQVVEEINNFYADKVYDPKLFKQQ